MTDQPGNLATYQLQYLLQLADNALIAGHRLSEWCGHGPVLEQDIAITNTALDHLGQARSYFQYAADCYNALSREAQIENFTSVMLQQLDRPATEDDLAYLRDGWDFRNVLLLEQPNTDWAYTVARSFFYDAFQYYFLQQLQRVSDERLAAIAEKSLKEVTYHLRWSSEWVVRLGDGTEESHGRMQEAINERWRFTGELMTPSEAEKALGLPIDMKLIRNQWQAKVKEVMDEATMTIPAETWMHLGGKNGQHTEHLGYILADLQFMQRAYPHMQW